LTTVEILFL